MATMLDVDTAFGMIGVELESGCGSVLGLLLKDVSFDSSSNDGGLLILLVPAPEDLPRLVEMVCAPPFTCIHGGPRILWRERSAALSPFLVTVNGNRPTSVLYCHISM